MRGLPEVSYTLCHGGDSVVPKANAGIEESKVKFVWRALMSRRA